MKKAAKLLDDKSYKIAILGKKDIVLGFKNFGLEVFPVDNIDDARKALRKIEKDDFAILFIGAEWEVKLKNEVAILRENMLPAVLSLPSHLKAKNRESFHLKEMIKRAVGKEIFFDK